MSYPTKQAAAFEAARYTRKKHRIVRVVKHKFDCLRSDGAIIPPYPCTCGGDARNETAGYALVLE